ncbi:periplasmic heavy metal sensor (plasmid) [Ensifer adhaerens]|uniref:periplasmic heavy metal sensor n=1 Tax=Ensifer adhaerens TaxID=106592 RepID=UPI002101095F|nr:periplasmic heavy metal sensor [Ensifer adhaerens]UTV41812.1 periplasmic heavy metal sensor [Ensifer adhaerens]
MMDRTIDRTLAVSLALNIFLVGVAVGSSLLWLYDTKQTPPRRTVQGLPAAAQELQPEQRKTFRQLLQKARRGSAEKTREGQRAREDLARLLARDPLDRAEIDMMLERIRNADMSLRTSVEAAVIDFAATLRPNDRAKLVEGLERNRAAIARRVSG